MGTAYLYGNGGSGGGSGGFGLQIVEGLVRPKNPTQGMVWAKTEHKVSYYDLSATKPENPVEGTLWVNIGDSSSNKIVSPVSKELITVYPLYAEQYVGGEWMSIEVMGYQDGEWVEWSTYYFKSGSGTKVQFAYRTGISSLAISVGTNSIKISTSDNDSHYVYTKEPQDLTNKSIVYMRYKATSMQSGHTPGLVVNQSTFGQTQYTGLTGRTALIVDSAEHTAALDVSSLTGKHYIGTNGVANMEIYDIWAV